MRTHNHYHSNQLPQRRSECTQEIVVSETTAQNLANAFNNQGVDWVNVWIAIATVATAILAAISAYFSWKAIEQNAQNKKDNLLIDLNNRFFEFQAHWATRGTKLTKHDDELLANFMDWVATLKRKGKLTLDDIDHYKKLCTEKDFVKFVKDYRQQHGSDYYDDLADLIDEFKKIV